MLIDTTQGSYYLRRRLDDTSDAGFVVTVPGPTTSDLIQSINYFQNNFDLVSEALGVDRDDVSIFFLFRLEKLLVSGYRSSMYMAHGLM